LVGTMGPIDVTRGEDLHPIHTSVLDLKAARDRLGRDKFTSRLERSKASTLRAEILRKKSLSSGTSCAEGTVTAGPADGAIVLADVNGHNHDDFEEHNERERRRVSAPSVVMGKSTSCCNGVVPSSLSSLNGINASAEQGTTRGTVKAVSFITSSEPPAFNTQSSPLPVNVVRSCSSTSLRSPKAHDQELELSDDSEQA
jgi:hypothetical protein